MIQALYTGVSGLKSNQMAIDVTSDNIANVSTVGFRGYKSEFASLFEAKVNTGAAYGSLGNNSNSVGLGSQVLGVTMDQNQGSIALTDKSTDLAIQGDGWFGVQNEKDTVYTRAGNFLFDVNSDLVTPDGYYVLGTMGSNIVGGEITEVLSEVPLGDVDSQTKLRFPNTLTYPAVATTNAKFFGNIGTEDVPRTIGAGVVQADGAKNNLRLSFTKSVPQVDPGSQWDVVATTQTLDGETIYDTKDGKVFFAPDGSLESSTLTTIDNNGVEITIDLGSGYDGVVSIANRDVSSSSSTDGTIGGELEGYSINKNAEVVATFTNGFQSSVGKIAVYHFQNDQGLDRAGSASFYQSYNSGKPFFFKDADGKNITGSDVTNYNLENSNVTLDVALTELIILQRAYDANSKSVSTADQMMQKALQMDA